MVREMTGYKVTEKKCRIRQEICDECLKRMSYSRKYGERYSWNRCLYDFNPMKCPPNKIHEIFCPSERMSGSCTQDEYALFWYGGEKERRSKLVELLGEPLDFRFYDLWEVPEDLVPRVLEILKGGV
jgi:hypothetical protein